MATKKPLGKYQGVKSQVDTSFTNSLLKKGEKQSIGDGLKEWNKKEKESFNKKPNITPYKKGGSIKSKSKKK